MAAPPSVKKELESLSQYGIRYVLDDYYEGRNWGRLMRENL
jgi:hypothetical protein